MKLSALASLFPHAELTGGDPEITGIATDSRKVAPGDLFVCLPGFTVDGHDYAALAIERGAAALVVERPLPLSIPSIRVKDCHYAVAVISSHYYGYPSERLKVIGVTGTNGKTTTTAIIDSLLRAQGHGTGLMGTIRTVIAGEVFDTPNTTQEAFVLQKNFNRMVEAGADYGIMEVSSHALDLGRVKGVRYRTAIFTNLTQDHLDYHKTMENYLAAKGLLFSRLGNEFSSDPERRQYAVLNADDPASAAFAAMTTAHTLTYGIDNECDVRAENVRLTNRGTEFRLVSYAGTSDICTKLVGKFNVYNALAAITAVLLEGVPLASIREHLEEMPPVEGRMEMVEAGQDFLALVDYAHSPDGLENALAAIRQFAEKKVITVFGCGGDRDRTKRPIMGEIAGRYSDYVLATSDNPRTEDPAAILREIEGGLSQTGAGHYEIIEDRRAAIKKAVEQAGPGDVLLIAGKGHETYQEINRIRHHFDDREEVRDAIKGVRIQ
ncbi:UDP-N-acetylmuramoyl-L-alanyl-D-glutamate--2,6-diaminopimelate ligase [Gorillibacterium timonense]|uniref:UDP-N-acetylmuramoyl-L-alanyl-D-glutamate--2, 6-diaminopimelate ligase n=1 Tax=Gorillibacterium timonense TaxID=1689269 RepID=UPI00071D9D37|nr:UDP-N-acetylmuramoyl-L-alanyl-D-glutamate--2,6-diaminopimelate ligase [Gorillibacterium timonense]